jgi:hypothetical protein
MYINIEKDSCVCLPTRKRNRQITTSRCHEDCRQQPLTDAHCILMMASSVPCFIDFQCSCPYASRIMLIAACLSRCATRVDDCGAILICRSLCGDNGRLSTFHSYICSACPPTYMLRMYHSAHKSLMRCKQQGLDVKP